MLNCFYYWKFKTNVPYVTYTVLTNIFTYLETAITTWCYSSTNPKHTLAN